MNSTETKNITELRRELNLLRSFVIGIAGKDKEGSYRPEFVRRILRAVAEESSRVFTDVRSFLRELNK